MKFGPRPLSTAKGCILAHSIALPKGRLRKGTALEETHIAQLAEAGLHQVTVAALDPDDVEENAAAQQLGEALIAGTTGIGLSKAATGRVNLMARGAGVAMLDVNKLTALNEVNPMISLATVPPFHQMHENAMLGTVKIIAYGVPMGDLHAACAHARGALDLAQPLRLPASLIITQIKEGADESKAIAATKARLAALGSALIETMICGHDTASIAATISRAKGDIILILTGSATSDPADVAPSALIQAGGRLERFGMPVDPGNLLFLGTLGDKPVIGLPGCARSPALNGADKVLSRVLCGVAITSADIAAMGVGGLLKEIPTRPRPREA